MIKLFTNQKETDRAIQAAVDQANRNIHIVRSHCAGCGYTPKPDEWSQVLNYCIDCA